NWSTGSTDSAITISKAGKYFVTVTDIFRNMSSDSIYVTYPIPNQISDTSICLNDTIVWNPQISGDYTYEWSNGETTSTLAITQTDSYHLTIRDNKGNPWYSDTISVVVDEFPEVVSLGNDTTICSGNRLYLTAGYEYASTYLWSNGLNSDHIILTNSGEYSVTVSNQIGCVGVDTVNISINGIAPNPDFSAENFCFKETTVFTDLSTSPDGSTLNYWNWNFGDGEFSSSQNSEHVFPAPGDYQIELEIGSDNNCNNSYRKTIKIFNLPLANFSPDIACSYDSTAFIDKSSSIDGIVGSWIWTFPDGIESTSNHPKYVFKEYGFFNVTLQATTNIGCTNDTTIQIEVKQGPKTDFSYGAPCQGQAVYFSDKTESFLNLGVSYLWNFNDEGSSTISSPAFVFDNIGIYNVTLTTYQSINKCSSSISKQIDVRQKPIADFTTGVFCENSQGSIFDNSLVLDAEIQHWKYIIDSLGAFYKPNLDLTINFPGSYSVIQIITDEYGCTDTLADNITVNPKPKPSFEANITLGAVPLYVDFINLTPESSSYIWNFDDGETSAETSPSHIYSDTGVYEIVLFAENEFACSDSISSKITGVVAYANAAILAIDAKIVNGYLEVSVHIQNMGTLEITRAELFLSASNGQTIKEDAELSIPPRKSQYYEFATKMKVNNTLTHVCASVKLVGFNDEQPDDDKMCFAFEDGFKEIKPYPNPADEELIIEYILPYSGKVTIMLFNGFGEETNVLYDGVSEQGFNQHKFDIRTIEASMYFCRIEYEGIIKTYQVLIK
ncbi:MAG: PKD domain-containing protein, partial [Salinivirgaceae bacterium]|nr:PKD domain-containing protein [Salinivirgaceae bacterium]